MDREPFLDKVEAYRRDGWRLALVNACAVLPQPDAPEGGYELLWLFERQGVIEELRHRVAPGEEVPSLSTIYGGAFLYENEIRDLFGVRITGLAVDFKGELYRTAVKVPFSPRAIQARLEASRAAPKAAPKPAAAQPAPAAAPKVQP